MNEEMTQQLVATAERLANAAEALDRVLGRLDGQQEALNAKVDRIVAAVEERMDDAGVSTSATIRQRSHIAAAGGRAGKSQQRPESAGDAADTKDIASAGNRVAEQERRSRGQVRGGRPGQDAAVFDRRPADRGEGRDGPGGDDRIDPARFG